MTTTGPAILTGIDLPAGSPGGSVELLRDLYLGGNPLVPADVFMLAGAGGDTAVGNPRRPGTAVLLDVPGKTLAGPGFWAYVNALAQALRQCFRAGDHGVLHLQHLAFGATPALMLAFPHLPRIALLHGTDLLFAADHPTQHVVLVQATTASDAVVAPTIAMADRLCRTVSNGPRRIEHIPWGVPDHLLSDPPPRPQRPAGGPLRVLYAGRLTAEKGGAELFAQLSAVRGAGIEVAVAAPPGQYAELSAQLDPGHTSGLQFLGWLDRPALWHEFTQHDVLVVPSNRLEAFGLVAIEAQACGLPVLYRRVPGLAEVLGDSAACYDPDESPDALPRALVSLRADPSALADLRRAGHRNALRYPLSGTANALRALSDDVQKGGIH
jgi:glycosyltransferase involved in cell wall biosynthesis